MSTFIGLGKRHVERHYAKTGSALYLHHCRIVTEVSFDIQWSDKIVFIISFKLPEVEEEVPKKKPTRMAIGNNPRPSDTTPLISLSL
jgi:hypothetical protein